MPLSCWLDTSKSFALWSCKCVKINVPKNEKNLPLNPVIVAEETYPIMFIITETEAI